MPCSRSVGTSGATLDALLVGDRQQPDLVVLGQRQADVHGNEHRTDMAADQVLHGGRGSAVGHVLDVGAGRELEQLHGKMMRGATSRRGVVDLARMGLQVVDELLAEVAGQGGVDRKRHEGIDEVYDRSEVGDRVVGHALEQRDILRKGRGG